jgi:hypothetical protein
MANQLKLPGVELKSPEIEDLIWEIFSRCQIAGHVCGVTTQQTIA